MSDVTIRIGNPTLYPCKAQPECLHDEEQWKSCYACNPPSAPVPEFDCHFSDIRKEIEAAITHERVRQGSGWPQISERAFGATLSLDDLLAKLEEKYGRRK